MLCVVWREKTRCDFSHCFSSNNRITLSVLAYGVKTETSAQKQGSWSTLQNTSPICYSLHQNCKTVSGLTQWEPSPDCFLATKQTRGSLEVLTLQPIFQPVQKAHSTSSSLCRFTTSLLKKKFNFFIEITGNVTIQIWEANYSNLRSKTKVFVLSYAFSDWQS